MLQLQWGQKWDLGEATMEKKKKKNGDLSKNRELSRAPLVAAGLHFGADEVAVVCG